MRLAPLAIVCIALVGCDRGCGRDTLDRARPSPSAPVASQPFPLNAVDCPDGLARCRDGVVEISRLFSYPVPCTGPAERCTCPWDRLSPCDHGCVAEEIELALPRDRAFSQLCAPSPSQPVARAPVAGTTVPKAACDGELYRCVAGNVVACASDDGTSAASPQRGQHQDDAGPAVVATCAHGCADEGDFLDDGRITRDQAALLLCRR
jgi:hypothetical protein